MEPAAARHVQEIAEMRRRQGALLPWGARAARYSNSADIQTNADINSAGGGATTTKVVHFIRHGQAMHNALAAASPVKCGCKRLEPNGRDKPKDNCPYNAPAVFDASLTGLGQEQALQLADSCAALGVQLIVSSPLQRTLQTALYALGDAIDGERVCPVLAHENLRERAGMHLCDRRRDTAAILAEHGTRVNLDGLSPTDQLWTDQRESLDSVAERCAAFVGWLMQRPEEHIVVTSHHHFLLVLFHAVLMCDGDEELLRPFAVAELRSVQLRPVESMDACAARAGPARAWGGGGAGRCGGLSTTVGQVSKYV